MTKEWVKDFEKTLLESGYVKYNSYLSSTEDYGYFKSYGVTYDKYGEKKIEYQIEYRFWDWGKYGEKGVNEFGVDIIIINSAGFHRMDMILTTDEYDISKIEKVAEDFNSLCKKHKLL